MASVTLGQHPAQHHIDSEQSFFLRKLLRKPSREKMMSRGSSLDTESAAPGSPAAISASLSSSQPLITENGLSARCAFHGSLPPRSSDDNAAEDNGNMLEESGGRACRHDSMFFGKDSGPTGQNTNGDITTNGSTERDSVSDTDGKGEELSCHAGAGQRNPVKDAKSTRAATCTNGHPGRRLSHKYRSLSGEGLHLDRVTQGRTGIVRIMRTEPPRREAWSIFNQADPRVKAERGEGHLFVPKPVAHDWCDACNRQISAGAVQCKYLFSALYLVQFPNTLFLSSAYEISALLREGKGGVGGEQESDTGRRCHGILAQENIMCWAISLWLGPVLWVLWGELFVSSDRR
ncbi:hypothetical protein ACEWY4_013415 [Coilia grayii]|uniref:Uncharacterized protein n=1 Tax=Coilia grayii TaxID=363190 RepID=A0ABD1JW91_9TELE